MRAWRGLRNERHAATGDFLWHLYAEDLVFVARGDRRGPGELGGIRPRVIDVTDVSEAATRA